MRRRRTDTTNSAERERFELLFDRHRRAVLGYALRRVEQPADAADVLAETFLIAWRKLDDVPAGSAALPWLLGVARRVLANQRRGARRRGGLAERLRGELSAALPQHAAAAPADSEQGRLAAALARLPEADRELILLVGWEELEPAQIAVVLGIQAETVRTRLHRARARLRDALAAEEGEPAPGASVRSVQAHPPAGIAQMAGEGGAAAGKAARSVPSPQSTAVPRTEARAAFALDAATAKPSLDAAVQPTPAPAVTSALTAASQRPPHAPARLGGVPPRALRPLTLKETSR